MRPDPRDVLGLALDQPFQQRARGVQDEGDLGIALEHVEERQVAVAVGLLEDAVEVADGLVVVQGEDQADAGHERTSWSQGSRATRSDVETGRVDQDDHATRIEFGIGPPSDRAVRATAVTGRSIRSVDSRMPGRPCHLRSETPARGRLSEPVTTARPGPRRRAGADLDLAEEARRVLGRDRVDVEPRAPLEAGDLGQPGDDLDVPVVVRQLLRVERRGVDDVVVGRVVERQLQLVEDLAEHVPRSSTPGLGMFSKWLEWALGRIQVSNGNRLA